MRDAEVRFYIDADLLGVAKILASIRNDITYPGDPGAEIHKRVRPACPINSPATPDTQWLPIAAAQGWLVISRDHNIRENYAERHAVRDHGARMVALAGSEAGTKMGATQIADAQVGCNRASPHRTRPIHLPREQEQDDPTETR